MNNMFNSSAQSVMKETNPTFEYRIYQQNIYDIQAFYLTDMINIDICKKANIMIKR